MSRSSSRLKRRQILGSGALTLAALGFSGLPLPLRRALAGPVAAGRKLLVIFLRGGIDAVQAVIPHGDAGIPGKGIKTYLEARPTLGVPREAAHDLNGFVSLHPAFQSSELADGPRVADIFHDRIDGRGAQLAILHRIGYEAQNRSHFSSQQFWENGVPGSTRLEEGVFNRYLTEYPEPGNPLPGAAVGSQQTVLLKGRTVVPVLRSIESYSLPAGLSLGRLPTPEDSAGSGLLGAYGQDGFDRSVPMDDLTYSTGRALLDGLRFFDENVRAAPYSPDHEATRYYAAMDNRSFAGYVGDAARLLKQVPGLHVVSVNQGNYDTHAGESTTFPRLIRDLGLAFTALYHDLRSIWKDTLILTLSEFGRTSEENGNRGTDHAEATALFALGGGVRGGVYNADSSRWAPGDLFSSSSGRYLAHRTDFRAVYAEVIQRHLGDPAGKLDKILPGYSQAAARDQLGRFVPLDFLGVR